MILGFKLGRRLLAAVGLDAEQFGFVDSRYVGRRQTLTETASAYFHRVIDQARPSVIYVYAPTAPDEPESLTKALVGVLETEAGRVGVPVKELERADLFGSFGLVALRTRPQLFDVMSAIWPALSEAKKERQLILAEAGAAALVGDIRQRWPPV